ncbi:MAG: rhomboid family intramembrane serine protease [Methanoregula sp.]|uniref:rhomboid family intramembrane serine protease n=1 Tax=Methanoregula sp. TaxID=2052170 RepID=UPI003C28F2F8
MNIFTKVKEFRSTINIRLFSVYLAVVLIIPAITTIIEYLISVYPSLRSSLQIDLQDFHVYQLFMSSFVHLNFDHFLANVTAYLLIAIYGLVLATIVNRKRLYLVLSKVIVVIFLIFGAVFAFFNATTTYYAGLSGIDSALAGLLLIFWLIYLEHLSGRRMRSYYGLVLACVLALSAGIIARYMLLYHTPRSVPFLIALAAVTGMLVLVVFSYRHQFVDLYRVMQEFTWSSRLITIAIVIIFGYFVWNLFPERLANSTRTVSISLHVAGIVIGILAGYLFLVYLEQIAYFNKEKEVISRP